MNPKTYNITVGNAKDNMPYDRDDFVLLKLETEFKEGLVKNALESKKAPHSVHTIIRFEQVLENLWQYYQKRGGNPRTFVKMLSQKIANIKGKYPESFI